MPSAYELNEQAIAAIRAQMEKLNKQLVRAKNKSINGSQLKSLRCKIKALRQEVTVRTWLAEVNHHPA
jgi:hypothetical protein